jgi:hypothetical protein
MLPPPTDAALLERVHSPVSSAAVLLVPPLVGWCGVGIRPNFDRHLFPAGKKALAYSIDWFSYPSRKFTTFS